MAVYIFVRIFILHTLLLLLLSLKLFIIFSSLSVDQPYLAFDNSFAVDGTT